MLLGQPMEEVGRVARQDLVVVECGDGLNALLQLFQTRFHTLNLQHTHTHTHTCPQEREMERESCKERERWRERVVKRERHGEREL